MLMIIALGLVALSSLVFAVVNCFVKRDSQYFSLLKGLGFMTLICLGLTCASYKNAFDGYSILLTISVLPLFLTLFNFSAEKPQTFKDDIGTVENYNFSAKEKKPLSKIAILISGSAYLASSACIVFCGLYIGVESIFGYLAGLFAGLSATFLEFLIKKQSIKGNLILFFGKMLYFVSIGVLICCIVQVLLYATTLTNVLFACACLAFAVNIAFEAEFPNQFSHIAYYCAMFLLFASIVF